MRKWLIDTDTGSDDAVALMLAIRSACADICAVTTVCGNVSLEKATKNALMTLETCHAKIPLYQGADRPLLRPLITAEEVHGSDGMGDCGLICPTTAPQTGYAPDVILDLVRQYPDELEILALGPMTNIALALMRDRQTMMRVKRIHTMGTAGFGAGNITPVAEFNVFVDAEAYRLVLESGIPITVYGFDLCLNDAELTGAELEELSRKQSPTADFTVKCTAQRLRYNREKFKRDSIDLPDPVAAAVALYPALALETVPCYAYCCTAEEATYGQVILYESGKTYTGRPNIPVPNADVVKRIDAAGFRKKILELL